MHVAAKSDAFPALQAWALAREVETRSKIGIYRSDNGELKTLAMRQWLLSRGSIQQFTAPYTSVQNGRVEHLHRTLMGKAHAMRSACGVPVNRWDEFVLMACYLSNYEHWTGSRPDLSHLREIGCRAFVLIQNQHNPKVNNRSIECVLIGYSLDSKVYRCYHRATHKVFISYHVSFIESHQHGSPIPPVIDPSPPCSVTVEEVPDIDAPTPSVPPSPDLPRRSSHPSNPSERHCAAEGRPFVSSTQHAVLDSLTATERLNTLFTDGSLNKDALAALLSEEELAHLTDIFAAMPDNLEHEMPDDPTTYAEAMASEHSAEWTQALKEEFDSLHDLGVYKLVPRLTIPTGRKVMRGQPVFKLKRD
jgi:hypothetical protein